MKVFQKTLLFFLIFVLILSASVSCLAATDWAAEQTVALIDGQAVDWIDRVALPSSLRTFYDVLCEGADGDGEGDVLIDDVYLNDPEYSILAISESFSLDGRSLSEVQNEVFDRYEPYMYAVFSAFHRDHPEIFWLNGRWAVGSTARSEADRCTVEIFVRPSGVRAEEYPNERAIRSAIAARDAAVRSITQAFNEQTTTYEKIVAFNEALTKNNQYNTSVDLNSLPNDPHECISAMQGRIGKQGPVCEGYAKAFKVLCDAEKIPCVLVDGMAVNSTGKAESHMWNYVQLQGAWYGVDVTWNDPAGGENAAISGVESQKWLLVGADTKIGSRSFLQSHPVRNLVYVDQLAFVNGPDLNRTRWESALTVALVLPEDGFVYNGNEQKPKITVKFDGAILQEGRDYTVEHSNSTDAGEATVCVKGKGTYSGEILEKYIIDPKPIALSVTAEDKIYDGTKQASVTLALAEDALAVCDRETVQPILDSADLASADVAQKVALTVTAHLQGEGSENYRLILPVALSINILPREIRVLAEAKTLAPDETEVELTYAVDSATPMVEGDQLIGSLALGERRADGSYPILQGELTDENNPNYRITFVSADVTVATGTSDLTDKNGIFNPSEPAFPLLPNNSGRILVCIGAGAVVLVLVIVLIVKKKK